MLVPVSLAVMCGALCGPWLLRWARGLSLGSGRRYWRWQERAGLWLFFGALFALLSGRVFPSSLLWVLGVLGAQGGVMALAAGVALARCALEEECQRSALPLDGS